MKRFSTSVPLILSAFFLGNTPAIPADDLTESAFHELRKVLIPPEDEPWKTIPWRLSLLAAQAEAGTVQKPIFIWAMNGHPLGCV